MIAKLMGKGILVVGFPDSSHIQPEWSQSIKDDKKNLRSLIYSCVDRVLIPKLSSSCQESHSDLACQNDKLVEEGEENGDQPRSRSCCLTVGSV